MKIKETNRIAALQNELVKFGAKLTEPENGKLEWDGKIEPKLKEENPTVKTYHDHRMALAFAPLALAGFNIQIENPQVVTKSYPKFWDDLKNSGFVINEIN